MKALLSNSEWGGLYNLDGLTDVFITADVDWAPDFALERMLNDFDDIGVNATIFATHRSSLLARVGKSFEIGIHPDFTRTDRSQTVRDKVKELLETYPAATVTRSHRNFFGQNTCQVAAELGLKADFSHVHFQLPFAQVFRDQYGLVRASYTWEDGLHLDYKIPMSMNCIDMESPGLKVFNFHPVLYYLNVSDDNQRRSAVAGISDLTAASKSRLEKYAMPDSFPGIRQLSLELLKDLKRRGVRFRLSSEALVGRNLSL